MDCVAFQKSSTRTGCIRRCRQLMNVALAITEQEVNEQTFQPCTIKLVRSFKDGFSWFCRSRDVSRVLLSILSRHTRGSVRVRSCGDGISLNKVGQPAK